MEISVDCCLIEGSYILVDVKFKFVNIFKESAITGNSDYARKDVY